MRVSRGIGSALLLGLAEWLRPRVREKAAPPETVSDSEGLKAQLDFFQSRHDEQISRAQKFGDKLRNIVTGLSLVFALLGYFAGKAPPLSDLYLWTFWLPAALSGVCIVASIVFLGRVYVSPPLEDLAPSALWFDHVRALEQRAAPGPEGKQAVVDEFTRDLIGAYVQAATANQRANDRIGYAIDGSTRTLICAACAALLSIPAFFYSQPRGAASAPSKEISMNEMSSQRAPTTIEVGPPNVPRPGDSVPHPKKEPGDAVHPPKTP